MANAPEIEINITDQERNERIWPHPAAIAQSSVASRSQELKWWIQIAIYVLFVLAGQSTGTLLGRLYYDKGGKSIWLESLVSVIGFPILIPLHYIQPNTKAENDNNDSDQPSVIKLATVYLYLGLLAAACTTFYSIGLLYLPVSTYSLICASQLAFNAVFAFFLNAQKFTPYILNSLVLLTISSTLLVFHNDSSNPTGVSKAKYAIGFVCTIVASATFSFLLSSTQLIFEKVIKRYSIRAILDVIIYPNLVASWAILTGLFASGDWRTLKREMEEFELGNISYLMTLIWTALTWQVYNIGAVGLIVQVSSLFSNVISTLGCPIVPVLAVIFFHDKMDGIKVMAMLLAIWGFVSYTYQQYLDDQKANIGNQDTSNAPKASQNGQ
ncbi:hypothetical protein Ancab_033700 [Ancistrocladus abbreviatus]